MFQLLIPLIAAMTVYVSNWTGNPFESHAAEIKLQKAPVNIIIPDDVMTEFSAASQAVKEKHCSANNDYPYQEITRLAKNPPKRIFGYNSRMDNLSLIHI